MAKGAPSSPVIIMCLSHPAGNEASWGQFIPMLYSCCVASGKSVPLCFSFTTRLSPCYHLEGGVGAFVQ